MTARRAAVRSETAPPWRVSFALYVAALVMELGRELTAGERIRARNGYSRGDSPSALAGLIRSGR